jgi:hypothetical protein
MALINCPECKRLISDKVKACPHCGYPFTKNNDTSPQKKIRTVLFIFPCLIAALLFFIVIITQTWAGSWDEGFNTSWVGTYTSSPGDDYVAAFKIGGDGIYAFAYGAGAATTYAGKYNRNFNNGVSKSPFQYTITGLRIVSYNEISITLSVNWTLPSGNDTELFTLYRQ